MATPSWSRAGPPPGTPLSQAALRAVGQEVHSSDKNTMRKNDLEAAPAPCRSHWSCPGPVHLWRVSGLRDPWEQGCFSRHPCRVPGTACSLYGMMLQRQETVLGSCLHQEEGRCAAALIQKSKEKNTTPKKKKGLKSAQTPTAISSIAIGTGLVLWQPDNWVL